ncbi:MAG: hypothetical protein WCT04_01645 [Planctomycetota bacterium]
MVKVTGMLRRACVLVAGVALVYASAVRAATLESVQKSISDAWEKASSATYDMETITDSSGPGYSMKMTMTGTSEMSRAGGKYKMRMESKAVTDQNFGGNASKSESKSTMIVDGDFAYTIMDTAGQKMAMKMSAAPYTENAGGDKMFKSIAASSTLTLAADESVDGQAAYVIEAKEKTQGSVMSYYFSKDNGFVLQMISKGPDGKTITTTKMKNIKIGASIPADHFVFTAPAGVQVQDMTNAGK